MAEEKKLTKAEKKELRKKKEEVFGRISKHSSIAVMWSIWQSVSSWVQPSVQSSQPLPTSCFRFVLGEFLEV